MEGDRTGRSRQKRQVASHRVLPRRPISGRGFRLSSALGADLAIDVVGTSLAGVTRGSRRGRRTRRMDDLCAAGARKPDVAAVPATVQIADSAGAQRQKPLRH